MTKTAFLENTRIEVFDEVYFPQEDSYLLAGTTRIKPGSVVLDLGCGSGMQSINALLKGAKKVVAVDINEKALQNTLLNAEKNGFGKKIFVKKSNLFEKISQKFDTIIFNPPYVESEKKELLDVDGGKKGRELLDAFLKEFERFLKENGDCFFLQSSLNGVKKTEKILKEHGFLFEVMGRQKLFFEELLVFHAWKRI